MPYLALLPAKLQVVEESGARYIEMRVCDVTERGAKGIVGFLDPTSASLRP